MKNKHYKLVYLPIFYEDLLGVVDYISNRLGNKKAAEDLLNLTETAILKRLNAPEADRNSATMEVRRFLYNKRHVNGFV